MADSNDTEHLLWLLEHGTQHERIVARTRLGTIFAQRGQWDYAAECIEQNINEGVQLSQMFRILAGIRLKQGRAEEANTLLNESRRLAEQEQREINARVSGRMQCTQCGHWTAPTRTTCKNCRSPLGPVRGGQVATHETYELALLVARYRHHIISVLVLGLLVALWPYLSWGSILVGLAAWFIFGLVLRVLGLYSR